MTKQEIIASILFRAEQEIKECTNQSVRLYCKNKEVNTDAEVAEFIIKLCADEYNITVDTLIASTRMRIQCEARQMSMKLIKQHTTLGLKDIGLNYNSKNRLGKDHTTVISAIKTIDNLLSYDKTVIDKYQRLVNNIMLIRC
ncbi:MAG: helix-turn-helix domain-containing protein [Bacteroidia bacterium]